MEEFLSRSSTTLPVPLSGLKFHAEIWRPLNFVPDNYDFLEEVVLLSKGPLGLYLRSTFELSQKGNVVLSSKSRLSGSKIKLL